MPYWSRSHKRFKVSTLIALLLTVELTIYTHFIVRKIRSLLWTDIQDPIEKKVLISFPSCTCNVVYDINWQLKSAIFNHPLCHSNFDEIYLSIPNNWNIYIRTVHTKPNPHTSFMSATKKTHPPCLKRAACQEEQRTLWCTVCMAMPWISVCSAKPSLPIIIHRQGHDEFIAVLSQLMARPITIRVYRAWADAS